MEGLNLMDWMQLTGIGSAIVTLVWLFVKVSRDTKSLSDDHRYLQNGQSEIKKSLRNAREKRESYFQDLKENIFMLSKGLLGIEKDTNNVWKLLLEQQEKEKQKLSLLSYSQQDIQDSLEHIQGIFEEVKETNRLNAKLASEREELIRKNEELTEKNQQLQQKNHELTKKLDKVMNKGRSRGLER
ncbi:hypothetical protein ACX1Q7_002387 [Enterococcus faecalis]|uniref:Uncharacterized protein n=2 Tax=Enterococcus faecalis TaxID=1351 RepID=A0A1W6QY90_ENTFL|nr:hypothetical protein [Enterococcus faecalis]ARO46191.1 hypothetical protein [Enterococcus faecalis]EGO9445192.1 hypothetical protein [Enterococcus faecalis]MCU9795034.1 hypothetical protein [Enterococcus faecalis]MDN3201532.1 hypothetical protein [Enterococcus faecalis]